MRTTFKFWANGRRDNPAAIEVDLRDNSIDASADAEHITERMLLRAMSRIYPANTFWMSTISGFVWAQADRWVGDGAQVPDDVEVLDV